MSPERNVSLHVPRSVLWLLGLLLIAPWLLSPLDSVVAFYSSNHPLEIRRYRARNG
ncbi:MAG: hypothetical protein HY736_13265 [Verrucomicrobia bacterium]|nr:hypothetical protein [Verrucomicrobiota bacterium]